LSDTGSTAHLYAGAAHTMAALNGMTNGALDHGAVLSAGFKPLRKAWSSPDGRTIETSLSFNSKLAEMNKQVLWQNNNPWRTLTKNASFDKRGRGNSTDISRINEAVVVVDPFSSGALLAEKVVESGRYLVRVFSEFNSPVANLVSETVNLQFDATVQHDDRIEDPAEAADETAKKLKALPWPIVAVMAGAETGVEVADRLATRCHVLNNGEKLSTARRNKYLMGETVRAAGIRAVQQQRATEWSDIEQFLADWNPDPFCVVVKPIQSAGSDDVFKCESVEEVRAAFDKINGAINGLGLVNEGVLVQEFLDGTEYVVDSVSRDGVHKVTAIWEYDKRSVNDANFVYFGMKMLPASGEIAEALVEYSNSVLDALDIVNGPGHMEVKMVTTGKTPGPCLVEVGSRCHGGEGTWSSIADQCVGYNQIGCSFDAFVNPEKFDALPAVPETLLKSGREVFLVSRQNGVIRAIPGKNEIAQLPSFSQMDWQVSPGGFVKKTIDCFTRPGAIQLVHESEAVVEKDCEKIRSLETRNMFDFEIMCAENPEKGAVVVVDPLSSGALVAAGVLARDFRLVMVFSDPNSPICHMVTEGHSAQPDATVGHDPSLPESEALDQTVAQLAALPYPIVSAVPGAETGVELADQLAEKLGTRGNPLEYSNARRNKYHMGETVRAAGVRAVRQTKATEWVQIEQFLADWNPDPFVAIVKPIQSAGSDDVFKCQSVEEVRTAFEKINGSISAIGLVNEGVLVQEFLSGTEYVVDSVSRDGVHKVTAIWEYDKRMANGQFNTYFGMRLMQVSGEIAEALVEYSNSVLDALEIVNGPGHMEVMMVADGPCLVEVGSRCHGGEGSWCPIAEECIGYTQIGVSLDAYLRPAAFDEIPMVPAPLTKFGREVFLVAHEAGEVKSLPGVDIIRALPSFAHMELHCQAGQWQDRTVDCFTRPGAVQLVHESEEVVNQDYETIRALEIKGFFEFSEAAAQN